MSNHSFFFVNDLFSDLKKMYYVYNPFALKVMEYFIIIITSYPSHAYPQAYMMAFILLIDILYQTCY